MSILPGRVRFAFALTIVCLAAQAEGKSCVWKVTSSNGGTVFLGGSIHALQASDYPLPSQYNRAFDASSQLVLEEDPKTGAATFDALVKAGEYPKGDSLRNHVDPRTYAYLQHFFALLNKPEKDYSKFRPWMINELLEMPAAEYYELGVENFFLKRAKATGKRTSGLESPREHNQAFVGLSDVQSEALLLLFFINSARETPKGKSVMDAWRHGDADYIAQRAHEEFRDLPWMTERVYGQRNRNWIPKIERYLQNRDKCFVLVGAGHLGGADGLIALLHQRGYQVEQL